MICEKSCSRVGIIGAVDALKAIKMLMRSLLIHPILFNKFARLKQFILLLFYLPIFLGFIKRNSCASK
jgi:hypothetical protein